MALKVVGAGLGRTGTNSLKLALEELLGGPCYHMFELIAHPQQVPLWEQALRGEEVDWASLFEGYSATVDWPGCAFWRDLAAANPDAPVLLSTRESAQTWWASMEQTVVPALQGPMLSDHPELMRGQEMVLELFRTRFTPDFADRGAAILLPQRELAAQKLADVIRSLDRARLLDMASRARALGKPDAARVVAERCMELAR